MDSKANIFEIYYSAHHKCIESCNQLSQSRHWPVPCPAHKPLFLLLCTQRVVPQIQPLCNTNAWNHPFCLSFPHVIYVESYNNSSLSLAFFFFKILFIYLFLDRGERREKERERNINVWLPLACLLVGTWPATQACALTGNWTGTSWLPGPCSVHWATPAKVESGFLKLAK